MMMQSWNSLLANKIVLIYKNINNVIPFDDAMKGVIIDGVQRG